MSLIMDALEKVQRETKPPVAEALKLPYRPPPQLAAEDVRVEFARDREEGSAPMPRRQSFWVLVFAVFLFTAAVMGFGKISSGLSLPQPGISEPNSIPAVIPSAEPLTLGAGILRGVLQDPAGSYCILGDQILKTGDIWRGYTILSIEARQVVVQDNQNRLLTLYLQES